MMTVNSTNGEFRFNEWLFSPNVKLNDFKKKLPSKKVELWSENSHYVSYRLNFSEEYIIVVMFFYEKIKFIEIYPKNVEKNKLEDKIQILLQRLGGENNYSWGKIELNIDKKAGYESVIINYVQ